MFVLKWSPESYFTKVCYITLLTFTLLLYQHNLIVLKAWLIPTKLNLTLPTIQELLYQPIFLKISYSESPALDFFTSIVINNKIEYMSFLHVIKYILQSKINIKYCSGLHHEFLCYFTNSQIDLKIITKTHKTDYIFIFY